MVLNKIMLFNLINNRIGFKIKLRIKYFFWGDYGSYVHENYHL